MLLKYKYNPDYVYKTEVDVSVTTATTVNTPEPVVKGQSVQTSKAEYKVGANKTVSYTKPVPSAKGAADVVIPDSIKINGKTYKVTSVAKKAFANNQAVKTVKVGKYVTSIGEAAFKGCTSFQSVNLSRATSIGKEAFKGCTMLKTVKSVSKVKTVSQGAFYGCQSLTSVSFPGVVTVKEKAFASCTKLSSVTFGKFLTTLGKKVFDKDSSLKKVKIKSTRLKKVDKTSFSGVKKSMKLYLLFSKKTKYKKLLRYAKVKKVYVKKM